MPDSVTEKDFVAKISYNYSGQLPGEASIKIFVGEKYADKRMKYSLVMEDNTLGESQSAKVDKEGYLTVKQSHCSTYIVSLAGTSIGDVNEDEEINAKDALAVLKKAANMEITIFNEEAAETNGDSTINAKDALNILKYAAKMITEFPIEKTA